ncbi:MAG TPA: flagellar biosynthetic protein FliR [Candidatus Hydrogenedentes bacterium]|nr:flagellar biosynthetic protein FliR [Candidatus Hydrogenedentota bacterium]
MAIFEVELFKVFVLVLMRFAGLLVSAPVLGSRNFPAIGKIGLAALCAMLVTPNVAALEETTPTEPLGFAVMGAGELLIGLMMGFVMTIAFGAIQVAGQLMDMQSGFGMMNVFNPAMETQFPIFGFYFFIIAVLYLLVTDAHHLMLLHLVRTFEKIPLGGFVVRPALLFHVGKWGSAMFWDGLIIAAPVAGAMLLAYITMGLMGRVVPQIHLFVVGFPVTITVGLLMAALVTRLYIGVLDGMFDRMFDNVAGLVRGMA